MNRLRLLLWMPWVASAKYSRLFAALAIGGLFAAATTIAATGLAHASLRWSHACALAIGVAIWMLWSSYVPASLQLARNAHDLRLPRIPRDADLSLLLFVAISVVMPIVLCGLSGAPWLATSELFVCAAASGLAYILLPFYLGLPLVLTLVLLALSHALALHALATTPAIWPWLTGLLSIIALWRWWHLRRADTVQMEGWNAAALFYCYRQDTMRNGGWQNFSQAFLQRQLGDPGKVDFHGVGPDRPITAMRFALGGPGIPKPFATRVRDAGLLLTYVLLLASLILFLQGLDAHAYAQSAYTLRVHWISPLLIYLGVLMCSLGVSTSGGRVRTVWRKRDAELPLLALLPGLGSTLDSKRHVLGAVLLPAGVFLAGIAAILCMGALAVTAKPWTFLAMGLCCGGAFALAAAVTLDTLGGKSIGTAIYATLYLGLFVFVVLTLAVGLPNDYGPHADRFGILPLWLLLCWAGFFVLLGGMALRGWRGLQRRPHPFLANAP